MSRSTSLPDSQRKRLEEGEVLIETAPVAGSNLPRLSVLAVIDAPPERVWRIIDQVGGYAATMPGVKAAQELSRQDGVVRARVTIGMPFPLPDLTSVTEATHTEEPGVRYVRRWRLVEGDYKENSGSWTIEPYGGDPQRSLVVYELHAVPRIPVPAALQLLAQRKGIPRLIEGLRRQARG